MNDYNKLTITSNISTTSSSMLLYLNIKNPVFLLPNLNITVYLLCNSVSTGQLTGFR